MPGSLLVQMGFVFALCFVTAVAVYLVLMFLAPRLASGPRFTAQDALSEPRNFVFRDGYLISHSAGIGFLLPSPLDHLAAWDILQSALSEMAEGVDVAFDTLRTTGAPFQLTGAIGDDDVFVSGAQDKDTLRITVSAAGQGQDSIRLDRATHDTLHHELTTLRTATESTPILGWAFDASGQVIWANAAYRKTVVEFEGPEAALVWPIPTLFPLADTDGTTPRRRRLGVEDARRWFEVSVSPPRGGLTFCHGVPLDRVVKAEDSLSSFIQTLTKTFAFLPTGLAIFDRDGQLALFNPALLDLTDLDGAWLTQRPNLASFFDSLRERQRLPEPKDYKAWRDSLTNPEKIAVSGPYEETWSLPTGQTYRVTGRPHSEGAVALLIEDISSEVSVTRKFRADLEMFQSVIDAQQTAMIVLSPAGQIVMANAAYAQLWDLDPARADAPQSAAAAITRWQSACQPTPIWGDLRDFISSLSDRAEWKDDILREDGRPIGLQVSPILGGNTLVSFTTDVLRASDIDLAQPFTTARVAS